jgi:hypothetical protein
LEALWKESHYKAPSGKVLRDFIELCELALTPIAVRRGKRPDFVAIVKNVLYGKEPVPGPWEV